MPAGLTQRPDIAVQHGQELQRVQLLALETHPDVQFVTAQSHRLPGFDTLPELGEDVRQVPVSHFVLPVADSLADAMYGVIPHTRHDAAGHGGQCVAPHVEVDAVMKVFLARCRIGLLAVTE